MRLGLIARADNSGLGVQTWEYFRHLKPHKVLVINVGHLHDDSTHTNKRTDLTRFPGADVFNGWVPDTGAVTRFLHDLDVVLSAETFYSPQLPHIAREVGVKTVLVPNYEFLDTNVRPDLYAAPSMWHFQELPHPKRFLPVPIATDRFSTSTASSGASDFLHIVGRPAVHDRNGTRDLLEALQYVESKITVTVRCQEGGYVSRLIPGLKTRQNITLRIDPGDVDNYWDLYQGDVLIMPRRFGGLCLPVNEALGAGMPVIMPNISPNEWLPTDWLVPAFPSGSFMAKQPVNFYQCDVKALARKIDQFASEPEFYRKAKAQAAQLRSERSWTALKPEYERVLYGV